MSTMKAVWKRFALLSLLVSLVAPSFAADRIAGPAAAPPVKAAPVKPLRVLFIGNSYTFYNGGMGSLVQSLANSAKNPRRFEFVEVTKGGQSLEGHWKDGKALGEIRKGNWDYVVLQDHSLRPIEDRTKMYQFARMFDAEIRKTGAKTVFYETWARKNKPDTFANIIQAYTGLAKELSATVAPAGLAWQKVLTANPNLPLHIADLSHPTPAGSYLNACVFYQTFFGQSPEGLPRTLKTAAGKLLVDLPESEATLLQKAAAESCGKAQS
jgi:hypothetical protein